MSYQPSFIASLKRSKLPTSAFSALLSVRPGEPLIDGFSKAWKFIAEHQPVDTHDITFDYGGDSLTINKTETPTSSHPFRVGIRVEDDKLRAFVTTGRVNGVYVANQIQKTNLKDAGIATSILECENTYNEEASAFEAVGQLVNQDGAVFLKLTFTLTSKDPLKYTTKARFVVQPFSSSEPQKNEAYIPLVAIDKDNKVITLVSSHIRADSEYMPDGRWLVWCSSV